MVTTKHPVLFMFLHATNAKHFKACGKARVTCKSPQMLSRAFGSHSVCIRVESATTIYIQYIYGIFGRKTTKYTVICGVYIRFWPTLYKRGVHYRGVCIRGCLVWLSVVPKGTIASVCITR